MDLLRLPYINKMGIIQLTHELLQQVSRATYTGNHSTNEQTRIAQERSKDIEYSSTKASRLEESSDYESDKNTNIMSTCAKKSFVNAVQTSNHIWPIYQNNTKGIKSVHKKQIFDFSTVRIIETIKPSVTICTRKSSCMNARGIPPAV